ncbi:MAG: efflux RND transporter periplasmic adaptor subunit [Gammaproteobacteria bacterium]|nr:efflux RND transporter periplasmic adaptor subunit [Gammaproteobacteria bacterium]MDH5629307.1 efflux RND transporter periplasmic adaptor subunit [Gammaproteobacteria bacterium]
MKKQNNQNNSYVLVAGTAIVSLIVTFVFISIIMPSDDADKTEQLCWVAPMDPNYKKAKPGKSPMGMDLINVCEEGNISSDDGVIYIEPHVENNLGVRVAIVEKGQLRQKINTVGYVAYDENYLIHIHPRVEGWVDKLFIKTAGDPVKKGDPVYSLYSPSLVNAQEEYLLALQRNNQRLIKAAEDRMLSLQFPQKTIDDLKRSRTVKQSVTFYAPQSGVIDNLNIREGFYVKPGTTLMSIGAVDKVWVEADIFERQAADIKIGLPVVMRLDYLPGREWLGQVDYVYPTLNIKNRTFKVRLKFDNSDESLKPNMFAQVSILLASEQPVLLVPRESVMRFENSDRVVLALGNGQFKSVNVKVGRYDDKSAEILSGLQEGEYVVSSAQFLLDSESSKTSDFKRMQNDAIDKVWTAVVINQVMAEHRMINIDHDPIKEWGWPAMTMDFVVAEDVDISELITGETLHVEIRRTASGEFEVITIHDPDEELDAGNNSATVAGVINSIDHKSGIVNISREAIEKWDRPAATLDFVISDGADLSGMNLSDIESGMNIVFTFHLENEEFYITHIHLMNDMNSEEENGHQENDLKENDHQEKDHD